VFQLIISLGLVVAELKIAERVAVASILVAEEGLGRFTSAAD
jgi:hypothetical protein